MFIYTNANSKKVDEAQTLRHLRVSSDQIGIGRRTLVLVRHGAGHHLAVLLSHDVPSPLGPGVLKPNLHNTHTRNVGNVKYKMSTFPYSYYEFLLRFIVTFLIYL